MAIHALKDEAIPVHEYKCWPTEFDLICKGRKRFELRKDDRTPRPQRGDWLHLREWDPDAEDYTRRAVHCMITHVMRGGSWGLPDDLVLFSLQADAQTGPTPATLKAGYQLPEAPGCCVCGAPTKPVAMHTGDGWLLCWECDDHPGENDVDTEPTIPWPFNENYARGEDWKAAGLDWESV